MEHNTFATPDLLDETLYGLIDYFESDATQTILEQTPNQFTNYWITNDPLYPIDPSTWLSDQIGGNLETSLQRDQPCEPYSISNPTTFDELNDFLVMTNMEESNSTPPEFQNLPAVSEQQLSLSSPKFSDISPSGSDQLTISSPEESPTQSRTSTSSGMDWDCRHCARSFTKKYLRTKHEQVHTKPISCPLAPRCQHRTARKRDMRRHVAVHHAGDNAVRSPIPVQNFTCSVSGCRYEQVGFKRKDHLTRHLRRVHARLIH